MNLQPLFLKLPPDNIVRLKFTIESYEGIGVVRTLNSNTGEVVILALDDTVNTVREVVETIKDDLSMRYIPPPESIEEDWLLKELETLIR